MRDPLYLILKSLRMLLERLSKVVFFVFENYFPSPTPEEPDNNDFISLKK